MKLFISYSHCDSQYLELLKKHLITLERNKTIKTWCDHELLGGDELDETIKQNLKDSDIIVFLISVDFLNSFYCYEKEFLETLSSMQYSDQRVVPVIVRDCDWHDGKIEKYKCITINDRPISNHENPDTAWLHVTKEISKIVLKYGEIKNEFTTNATYCLRLNPEFVTKLNSTGMNFHHQAKGKLSLQDIFIFPQLKKSDKEIDKINFAIDSRSVFGATNINKNIIVIGDEQIGKTSLSNMIFLKLHSEGSLPLLFDGVKLKKSEVRKNFEKEIKNQYNIENVDDYLSSSCKKIIIVDDFHKTPLNEKSQKVLLENILKIADNIILVADNYTRYISSDYFHFSEYESYEILPFGHKLKSELIDKWNSIGCEETINIRELHTKNNITTQHLDSIVRKNILESKPIYLLIVLQSIESAKPNDYSLTSYGHCYQYLITQNFEKAYVKASELDTFFNYMTEIAFFMYENSLDSLNSANLDSFQSAYSKVFFVKNHEYIMSRLIESGIFVNRDGEYSFGYKYVFYFYVAKYLSDHIKNEHVLDLIAGLCSEMHIEKNANILIFLTHHSKDESIIDDIYLHVSDIYHGTNPAKLDLSDTVCLQEFIDLIPEKVYEQRDVVEERNKYLEHKDKIETISENDEKMKEIERKTENGEIASDILLNLMKALKSIEIIGQILRNRYGSLTLPQLKDLCKVAIDVGFKLLKFHLEFSESIKNEILNFIEDMIKVNKGKCDDKIIKEAKMVFLSLNYGIVFGIIRKISKSIGSDAIIYILDDMANDYDNSPAFNIMSVAVKLDFTNKIPKKDIENLYKNLNSVPVARRLLRDVIIQHAHLHHTEYQDKQWISNVVQIPMQSQRLISIKAHS